MSKKLRILELVQMLSHRRSVTLQAIMSICHIPERTAYRYLSELSEANISVSFDSATGGYRLAQPLSIRLDELSEHELVFLVACLQLASRHLNDNYNEMAQALIHKVAVRHPLRVEEVLAALHATDRSTLQAPDYSKQLSFALVQVAATMRLPITLAVNKEDHSTTEVLIREPGLRFHDRWQVFDAKGADVEACDLDSVAYVFVA